MTAAAALRGRHGLGEIIGYAYRVYGSNFAALLLIALVTAPVQMLQIVVSRRTSSDDVEASVATLLLVPSLIATVVAAGALVAAMHEISGGERASATRSLDAAFERFMPLLTTALLQSALAIASLAAAPALALWWLMRREATIDGRRDWWLALVPGALTVFLAVRWMFIQQAVMIARRQRWAALDASAAAVRGRWWRSFGIILVIIVIAMAPTALATASSAGPPLVEAVITSGVYALVLPFLFAAQTLLYYDLNARNADDAYSPAGIDAAEPDVSRRGP